MRLVPLLGIGFYTMLRREIQLKCELYNENFQNYKSYNIPKAQLIIADIPYNIGKNFYGSNPSWYVGGNRENGESKLAGKAAFNTDFSFNITELEMVSSSSSLLIDEKTLVSRCTTCSGLFAVYLMNILSARLCTRFI